jgi:hypothetical protein
MSEYTEVPVAFTRLTARNMKKGRPFQLSHSALSGDTHKMMVHPALAKKIQRSVTKQKGMRMSLSPEEIQHTMEKNGGSIKFQKTESARTTLPKKGTGWVNIGRAIKKGFKQVTDSYKQFRDNPENAKIRKVIQQGAKAAITAGITTGATALGTAVGAPQAGAVVGTVAPALADIAVNKIGLGLATVTIQGLTVCCPEIITLF